MFSMNVKAPIKSSYLLKEPLEIGGCVISREKERMTVSTTVKAENEKSGKKIALDRIRKAILSWSLATEEFLDFDETNITVVSDSEHSQSVSFTIHTLPGLTVLKSETEEEILKTCQLLKNTDDYGIKCSEYYERGIATRSWHSEAALNFYKVCELIYEKILAEASEEAIVQRFNKTKEKITMKEKMVLLCESIGLTGELKENALSLPKIRSMMDVGHARLNETPPTKEILDDFMRVAKTVVILYLKSTSLNNPLY